MPKLILRCNYPNNSPPTHLTNYINYIGTRDGVEKVSSTTALLPATAKGTRNKHWRRGIP